MEYLLRLCQFLFSIFTFICESVAFFFIRRPRKNNVPPIEHNLLNFSVVALIQLLQEGRINSKQIVEAYIHRACVVQPYVNAIIQSNFPCAREEAKHADRRIRETKPHKLPALFEKFPLLGIPFTVKESCGLKHKSFVVSSLRRIGTTCRRNGAVVELLRAAGGIPIAVTATSECCAGVDSRTSKGYCKNPYNQNLIAGGSSGGEAAMNGAGATPFGVASDLMGCNRISALFCGVFGHKPTGDLTSIDGHFPNCSDADFRQILQIGPITRFAEDLEYLTKIMAGPKANKLRLWEPVNFQDIKVYYSLGFKGLNGFLHSHVDDDIRESIINAVEMLKEAGLEINEFNLKGFNDSLEISLSALTRLRNYPDVLNVVRGRKIGAALLAYLKFMMGHSNRHSLSGILFDFMKGCNGFMAESQWSVYKEKATVLKSEIIDLLGTNGVLIFPTLHTTATHPSFSWVCVNGIDYSLLFNALGLPATHIPLGFDIYNVPVGFQVIAAPYMDKLCFEISRTIEKRMSGWVPPRQNADNDN